MLIFYADHREHRNSGLSAGGFSGADLVSARNSLRKSPGPEAQSMKGLGSRFLLLALLTILGSLLPAQSPPAGQTPAGQTPASQTPAGTTPAESPETRTAEKSLSPEQQVIEMDIKTSTLGELADWCRSLGLSEGGTKDELANRLRGHFRLPSSAGGQSSAGKQRLITIESAKTTEYFTLDAVNEEYARLRGGVVISLKDGEDVHRIAAEEILYNRTRNVMTASGGVQYEKKGGDTVETFKGESITVNLDNWSSLFLDGLSERALSGDETTYRFEGSVISRSDEEVTVLQDAVITNAKTEEPYWSLRARKLWLLPGSDWAVLSAVLKVGEIPLMYFPFFFFAADEVIFHPVIGPTIGHTSRNGNFLQTTTYLWGRPQAGSGSGNSLSKIMGNGADTEKVREGIFLRSTGKKYTGANDKRLSVLFDVYSNLGVYLGTQLALPKKGIFSALDASAGIGFTRDVYQVGSSYSPFAQYAGSDEWNTARLFGMEVPFRYRFTAQSSLTGSAGTLSWAFPFYSDPYTDRDFLKRSEEMDWIKLFKTDEPITTSETILGDHQWRLTGSLGTLPLEKYKISPYISGLTLSGASSVNFRSRQSTAINNGVSPTRYFFFPEKFTIYSITSSVSGTPLTIGSLSVSSSQGTAAEELKDDPFRGIGAPRPPWESGEEKKEKNEPDGLLTLPELKQQFAIPSVGDSKFSIAYQLSPTSATELRFRSSQQNWTEAEDIDWTEVSSLLTAFRGDGNVTFRLENQLYNGNVRFSGTGAWQGLTYLNPEAEEFTTNGAKDQTKIDNANLENYRATSFSTAYSVTAGFTPLYLLEMWKTTSLQYTLGGSLAKSEFDGTGADPSWKVNWGDWTKEQITSHQLSANIGASVMDKMQNVNLSLELPPRDAVFGISATARAWISETSLSHKIQHPWEPDLRKFDILTLTESIRWGTAHPLSFTQTATYDPEIAEFTNATSNLTWFGASASFTASRGKTYTLENTGWVQSEEPERLHPRKLQLRYSGNFPKITFWRNRISLGFNLNTNVEFDLQQYTNSLFTFDVGFTAEITKFLTLSFRASSENKVIFRYFQGMFDMPMEVPGEQNIFIDLANSFRFDDEELRRSSGFKLKSFNVSLIHRLGDWDATFKIGLTPYLDETVRPKIYKFNPTISFIVQWIPISELKTEIESDKDKLAVK
ncbi:MAG: LPS-assembly protein LptD [Spirochaetaceae bacterium]|nr:LPS-assembly protein LptD [Spirochaetaceae bacterium]